MNLKKGKRIFFAFACVYFAKKLKWIWQLSPRIGQCLLWDQIKVSNKSNLRETRGLFDDEDDKLNDEDDGNDDSNDDDDEEEDGNDDSKDDDDDDENKDIYKDGIFFQSCLERKQLVKTIMCLGPSTGSAA